MRILLKDVRQAFTPPWSSSLPANAAPGQVAKFNGTYIIPKKHKQVVEIEKILLALCNEKWGAKGPAILKALRPTDKICFRDGDGKPDWEGFEGNWYIKAANKSKPTMWDHHRNLVTEEDGLIYSGCWVNVSLDIKAYEIPKVGKGLNAVLRGVQFFRKGDAFSGATLPAEADDFEEISAPDEDGSAGTESDEDLLS